MLCYKMSGMPKHFSQPTQRPFPHPAEVTCFLTGLQLELVRNLANLLETWNHSNCHIILPEQLPTASSNGKAETPAVAKILPQSSHGSFSGIVLILTDYRVDSLELVHTTIA